MRRLTAVAFGMAYAHHAAEGIVDEEVYEMIDALVADTPHALLDINDLGGGMMEIVIQTPTVRSMENMIDDGLLTYLAMLDGEVTLSIAFLPRGGMAMEVAQTR